jgi:hypothetical protein
MEAAARPKTHQHEQQTGLSHVIATTIPITMEFRREIRPAGTRYALPGTREIRLEI